MCKMPLKRGCFCVSGRHLFRTKGIRGEGRDEVWLRALSLEFKPRKKAICRKKRTLNSLREREEAPSDTFSSRCSTLNTGRRRQQEGMFEESHLGTVQAGKCFSFFPFYMKNFFYLFFGKLDFFSSSGSEKWSGRKAVTAGNFFFCMRMLITIILFYLRTWYRRENLRLSWFAFLKFSINAKKKEFFRSHTHTQWAKIAARKSRRSLCWEGK